MNHRKILLVVLLFSVLMFVVALSLASPCHSERQYTCDGVLLESVAVPIGVNAMALFVVSIVSLFFSREVFKKWFMFASFYFVGTIILIAVTPVAQTGALGLNPDRGLVSLITSMGFVVVSVVVIVIWHIKLRILHNSGATN